MGAARSFAIVITSSNSVITSRSWRRVAPYVSSLSDQGNLVVRAVARAADRSACSAAFLGGNPRTYIRRQKRSGMVPVLTPRRLSLAAACALHFALSVLTCRVAIPGSQPFGNEADI